MGTAKNRRKAKQAIAQDALLNLTWRVRQSLELQEILSVTVEELRAFLKTDRVKIYRFDEDGHGQVIAESVNTQHLPSLQNLHFPAGDIPSDSRELFIRDGLRIIVNVPAQQTILSKPNLPKGAACLDLTVEEVRQQSLSEALQRPVDPCHVEYLTRMGVKSSLAIPIMHQQKLWGLLISHHAKPKTFSESDLQVVQALADQLAIAISQAHLLEQARKKAKREEMVNQISTLLHLPLPIQEILQMTLEQIVQALAGAGGRLYLVPSSQRNTAELYTCGHQPQRLEGNYDFMLEESFFWQDLLNSPYITEKIAEPNQDSFVRRPPTCANYLSLSPLASKLQVVSDLYQEPGLLAMMPGFQSTQIRSLLSMPLHYGEQILGCLTLFRNEIETDIVWAGKFDPDQRQERVRESFTAWRQIKQGQAHQWSLEEQEFVRAIATHLTLAVMQRRLYQCEHEQRILVEMRNRELNIARTVAEEANRLKSDFLASTSHELRTPLASTLNYLTLLKQGFYDDPQELEEYINIAHQSASNLVAIINDILDIAKIEAGRMSVELEAIDLPALLTEQSNLFRAESRHKGIPLVLDCAVDRVSADVVKLRQILTNLLANAFKFTSKGEVRITAVCSSEISQQEPPRVLISVSDTGIGLDADTKDRLFEPFVQADGSIKRRYGGTGLGLTVCKRLVELMQGEIWLESAGVGQGLTVTFTLPCAPINLQFHPELEDREARENGGDRAPHP